MWRQIEVSDLWQCKMISRAVTLPPPEGFHFFLNRPLLLTSLRILWTPYLMRQWEFRLILKMKKGICKKNHRMDCPTCLKSGDKRGDSDLIWGRLRSNIILLKGRDLKKKKKLSFPNFCKLIQIFFVIFFVTSRKKTYFFDLIWTRLRSCLLGLAVDRGEIWKVFQFPQTHKSLLELDWMKWSVSLICTNTLNLQFGHNFRFWINSFENSNSRKPL